MIAYVVDSLHSWRLCSIIAYMIKTTARDFKPNFVKRR